MNKLIKLIVVFSLLFCLSIFSFGQIEGVKYDDVIYDETIHAVKFHLTGFKLTQPIIDLRADATLTLSFDDLNEELRYMYYTIIHCDADWQPSELSTLEYLDGFDEDQVEKYEFSDNTLTEFTSYRLSLPNDRMKWTKSGNYILVVYENDGDKIPLFSRRFMVVDPLVRINPKMVKPSNVQKAKTHQELDFNVFFEGIKVKDPMKEIRTAILQNGRWDNAITDLAPYSIHPNNAGYDFQDVVTFPAGNEFRFIDLRSFTYKNEGVLTIEEYQDIYEITLKPESVRSYTPFLSAKDINGNYFIENILEEEESFTLRSDYALVLFSLEKNMPYKDLDVYLFGKITDWKIQERFKLAYSEKLQLYAADILLKQGYYNYSYVAVPKGKVKVDFSELEGNFFETENEYTILAYHRPFGGRYDQLVGAITIRSNQ